MKTVSITLAIIALIITSIVWATPYYGGMGFMHEMGAMHGHGRDGHGPANVEHMREMRTERFKNIDTDKDGRLSVDELKAAQAMHHGAGHGVDYMLKRHDQNGDSAISLDEFLSTDTMAHHGGFGHHHNGGHHHHGGFGEQ